MPAKKPALQTVTQAARQIAKTRSWVHQLISERRVPGAIQIGGLWLVPRPFKYISRNA